MKIAPRIDRDLAHTVSLRVTDGAGEGRSDLEEVRLRCDRAYDVLAVEFPAGQREPHFWVLGEEFASRVADGLVYPDLIAARDSRVVDATIPPGWVMRVTDVIGGTHTVVGAPLLAEDGFLERLTNGDALAVKSFLNLPGVVERA